MKTGLVSDEAAGPLEDAGLLQLAFDGTIGPHTLVNHATKTKGSWLPLARIPAAVKKYEEGLAGREEFKQQQKAAREAEKQAKRDSQRQDAIREAIKQEQALAPLAKFLGDGQDASVVGKIVSKAEQLLTTNEAIEYVAVQAKPLAIAPDAVVLTNRRLLVVRQKILGQMAFADYLWRDLRNAHVQEGMLFSEISFQSTDGQFIKLDYLPKSQARRIYRVAQEREEVALEERRTRSMEEQRAGASNIVVNAPVAAPAESKQSEDPVAKLQRLKTMLDAGLIEQEEYDATKKRILAAM